MLTLSELPYSGNFYSIIQGLLTRVSNPGYNNFIFLYQIAYSEAIQLEGTVISVIIELVFVGIMNFRAGR
jgi:hypothetical protein